MINKKKVGEKKKVTTRTVGNTKYTKTTTKSNRKKTKEMEAQSLSGFMSGATSSTTSIKAKGKGGRKNNTLKYSSQPMTASKNKKDSPKPFRTINKIVRKGLRGKKFITKAAR
jgi:hypothetical protein